MGIYDRDYMQRNRKNKKISQPKVSFWKRFKFRIWLILHPLRKRDK